MMDIKGAQHYKECSTCSKNAEFHCNSCGDRLCLTCKEIHQMSNATREHEIVIYRQKQDIETPDNCQNHPDQIYTLCCEQCEEPICIKCATKEHKGHPFIDFGDFFKSKMEIWNNHVVEIKTIQLPQSIARHKKIKQDFQNGKDAISQIRSKLKSQAEEMKNTIDEIVSEKTILIDSLEQTLMSNSEADNKSITNYIEYLSGVIETIEKQNQGKTPSKMIFFHKENKFKNIPEIPDSKESSIPSFEIGKIDKESLALQLGEVLQTTTEQSRQNPAKTRAKGIQPHRDETDCASFPLFSKLKEIEMASMDTIRHISCQPNENVCVSNLHGNLILSDFKGNTRKSLFCAIGYGIHTMTFSGDVLYIDGKENVLHLTADMKIYRFTRFIDGKPICLCVSNLNGDVLLVTKNHETSYFVARYDQNGRKKIVNALSGKRKTMYKQPAYIAENMNGDICISDLCMPAVVVADKSGKMRFSYHGQPASSNWLPFGLCTDKFGHILVCDDRTKRIHILDKDGKFLSYLVDENREEITGIGVAIMKELLLTTDGENKMTVYKYR